MIYYDVTKASKAAHRSGLMRVSARLRDELGETVVPVVWSWWRKRFVAADGRQLQVKPEDWWFTVELFSAEERRGLAAFVAHPPCRLAAMFHDAIPVSHPEITWPQSVRRHPGYMKLLGGFDRVLAISRSSRAELAEYWRREEIVPRAEPSVVSLGADFDRQGRTVQPAAAPERPALLCVGIVEPRKNQAFLLEVCRDLWARGVEFDLHVVGRVNPHFGEPIAASLRKHAHVEPRLHFHGAASDAALQQLYRAASAVVFPTIAEGSGLPLVEALWRGTPCVCSDLPVLRENAEGGGCLMARVNDPADWREKLGAVLTDAALSKRLRSEAVARELPTWRETAAAVLAALR